MSKTTPWAVITASVLLTGVVFAAPRQGPDKEKEWQEIQSLTQTLDLLDQQEFDDALGKAQQCTRRRDFACSERELGRAKRFAGLSGNAGKLGAATLAFSNEKALVEREEAARREAERQAELRRQRQEEEAERRAAEREARERADSSNSSSGVSVFGAAMLSIAAGMQEANRYQVQSFNEMMRAKQQAAYQQQQIEEQNRRRREAEEADRQRRQEAQRREREAEYARQQGLQRQQNDAAERARQLELVRQQQVVDQQRQADEARRQREEAIRKQAEQDRQLAMLSRQSTLPTQANVSASTPTQRQQSTQEIVTGQPNARGCWLPDPNRPCLVASGVKDKDEVRVTYLNQCSWGVYVRFGNERRDGTWDAGAEHISAGGRHTWTTSSGATGTYKFAYIGSQRLSEDWVCASTGEARGILGVLPF